MIGQIERANLAELDWALANMGGGRPYKPNKVATEMIEVDAGVSKEDERKEIVSQSFSGTVELTGFSDPSITSLGRPQRSWCIAV